MCAYVRKRMCVFVRPRAPLFLVRGPRLKPGSGLCDLFVYLSFPPSDLYITLVAYSPLTLASLRMAHAALRAAPAQAYASYMGVERGL